MRILSCRTAHFHVIALASVALALTLSACTFKATTKATTDVFTDFSSSTFGNPWLTSEGIVLEDYQPIVFIANNFESLQQDMAQGTGEHLASLGSLLGVPSDRQGDWFAFAQDRYPTVFSSGHTTPADVLTALTRPFPYNTR
jgi:hypothetical protein